MTGDMLKQANEMLKIFGEDQVPMIGFCRPEVKELTADHCTIAIPLDKNTKNHLSCMYFGALHVGSDCAGGLMAMNQINMSQKNISLIFKDSQAKFLKRAEGDVHFTCISGQDITKAIEQTLATGERVNVPVEIYATVPSIDQKEQVAHFVLTLSLKYQGL